MKKVCNNCEGKNLKSVFSGNFFDVCLCESCGYHNIIPLESCCRSGMHEVTEHVDSNGKHALFYQCINCGGSLDRKATRSIGLLYFFVMAKFDTAKYQSWQKERSEEGLALYSTYSSNPD